MTKEEVNHPDHYGGKDNPYEAIKVIEAWGLGFHLGSALKYIARAAHKGKEITDLNKAIWYIRRYINGAVGSTLALREQMEEAAFLRWLYGRLQYVHGESKDADFMVRLRDMVWRAEGEA
jgi:hypothetical protein